MVGTNPYIVVALRRRSGRCTVCPCCLLPVPCAVCACVLLCSVCTLLRHQCVRACCCAVRACCCVCGARVLLCRSRVLLRLQCVLAAAWVLLLRRPCAVCPCVRAAVSVDPRPVLSYPDVYTPGVGNNGRPQPLPCRGTAPSVRPAATVARGPFHRFRTFIPRRWETMVGTNPYHVVAAPRRSGRPPRSPAVRFIDFGRLYPGGGKQWSAPTPTMLWRRAVGPSGRHGRPRPVSSFSDVYTQEVGNNGRHQSLPCCGGAPSVRSAASVARGPFHRFRTFIPRRWETMVGTNPNLVVALRRPLGWCTV